MITGHTMCESLDEFRALRAMLAAALGSPCPVEVWMGGGGGPYSGAAEGAANCISLCARFVVHDS